MDLLLRMLFRDQGVSSGVDRVVGKLNGMKTTLGTAAGVIGVGFGASALVAYAKSTLQWADSLDAMSERLQVSTDELQVLQIVADKTNVSVEALAVALKNLTVSQARALQGKDDKDVFARMGVSLDQLKRMRPVELWSLIGAQIERNGQSAETMLDAMKLLGRTADQVLPAMKMNLAAVADEAKLMGQIVDSSTVRSLAERQEQLESAGRSLRAATAPALQEIGTTVEELSLVFGGGLRGFQAGIAKLTGDAETATALERSSGRALESYGWRYAAERLVDRDAIDETKRMERELEVRREAKRKQDVADASSYLTGTEFTSPAPDLDDDRRRSSTSLPSTADQLARIGLFTGGAQNQLRVLQQQVQLLRQSLAELKIVNHNLTTEE